MRDQLGRVIMCGSYIVYPGRRGSTMWITLAVVTDVKRTGICRDCVGSGLRDKNPQGDFPSCLTCGGTGSAKLESIQVKPIDFKTKRPIGKPSTITRCDLVTVVTLPDREI